ncbi:hypothetical protein BGX23_008623 [Mortierella sp. AD031]|nr:hypothetical protein BGX23_008623 [Mortierella sp. AD031]KAG0213550.1 hypothetical protein BGX33_002834 [Mortierella sp. NVP41]
MVDFYHDTKFIGVGPKVLETYGGYIRQVLNISTLDLLTALQHPGVDSLQSVDVLLNSNVYHRELLSDPIRRCRSEITEMTIHCPLSKSVAVAEQRHRGEHGFQVNTLISCPMPSRSSTVGLD